MAAPCYCPFTRHANSGFFHDLVYLTLNVQSHRLVSKLWNCCNILRDDRLSYGNYVEQLTFLRFLKMAD